MPLARRQANSHERMDYFVGETWSREKAEHRLHSLGGAPGFFLQFTHCTCDWCFVFLQFPRWNLVQVSSSRVPILPDEHYLRVGPRGIADERKNGRRTGVPYDLHVACTSVRKSDLIDIQRNDLAGIDSMRCDLWVGHESYGFAFMGLRHQAVRMPALRAVHELPLRHQQPLSASNLTLHAFVRHEALRPPSLRSFVHDTYRTSLPATHR